MSFRSGVGSAVGDPAEDLGAVAAVDGRAERQQLVERHAQRVDVGPAVDHHPPAQGLLGAHVPQRAQDVAGERQPVVAADLRQAEVGDPEPALGVEQQVARLDVAVEDAAGVGVIQRLGGLERQPGGVAGRSRGCGWMSKMETSLGASGRRQAPLYDVL